MVSERWEFQSGFTGQFWMWGSHEVVIEMLAGAAVSSEGSTGAGGSPPRWPGHTAGKWCWLWAGGPSPGGPIWRASRVPSHTAAGRPHSEQPKEARRSGNVSPDLVPGVTGRHFHSALGPRSPDAVWEGRSLVAGGHLGGCRPHGAALGSAPRQQRLLQSPIRAANTPPFLPAFSRLFPRGAPMAKPRLGTALQA